MTALFQLPVARLVAEQVPADQRGWVERALIVPLNRFMQPVADALQRIVLSQLNAQVVELKGYPPSASSPLEATSTVTGRVAGLVPMYAMSMDASGGVSSPVSGLSLPAWMEVAAAGRAGSKLRIISQPGLTAGTRYLVRWLAFGG